MAKSAQTTEWRAGERKSSMFPFVTLTAAKAEIIGEFLALRKRTDDDDKGKEKTYADLRLQSYSGAVRFGSKKTPVKVKTGDNVTLGLNPDARGQFEGEEVGQIVRVVRTSKTVPTSNGEMVVYDVAFRAKRGK